MSLKLTYPTLPRRTLFPFSTVFQLLIQNQESVLPVFYSDNYISILPGTEKSITIDLGALKEISRLAVKIQGWNTNTIELKLD